MIGGTVAFVAIDTYVPFWYKRFFNTLAGPNVAGSEKLLLSIIGVVALLKIISWVFKRLGSISIIFLQPRVMSDLKNTCYRYLHRHSYNFFNNNFTGSLVRKVNKYAQSFETVSDLLHFELGRTIIHVSILLVVLFIYYWQIGILALIWAVVYTGINFIFSRYKYKYDVERTEMDTVTTGHLADTITNNLNIKLFGSFAYETRTFEKLNEQLRKLTFTSWRLRWWADVVQGFLNIVLEFGVFYIAIHQWRLGILTIGDFALLQAYVIQIFSELWGLGKHIQRLYERLSDAEEMTEVLEMEHDIKDAPNAGTLKATEGKIEFSNVTFAYPNQKPIFSKFNIEIEPGERVALISPSGGGKTTFTKLLFRFYDIKEGQVMIDGTDIASVTQKSLRDNIGLVPQDPILFHRTLMDNIRYGRRSATNEEVIKAAKLAHCHEFISQFPDQYNTYVGERGVKLSGGERQRVAIARAMLENAPILVLDEATSSLDSESEHYIQDALQKLMKGKTTIVIAHRLSTIMQMDRIIVIENGTVTEEGTHAELLKINKGTYQKLWNIQAGGFIE